MHINYTEVQQCTEVYPYLQRPKLAYRSVTVRRCTALYIRTSTIHNPPVLIKPACYTVQGGHHGAVLDGYYCSVMDNPCRYRSVSLPLDGKPVVTIRYAPVITYGLVILCPT